MILGKYLVLKKSEELFNEYLNESCKANSKQSKECFQCLSEWWDRPLSNMSTTSVKVQNIVVEPMGDMRDHPVTDLDGIGPVLGKRLDSKGFDKVSARHNVDWHHSSIFLGIYDSGTVLGIEKERRTLPRMVEGDLSSKLEAK